MTTHAGAEAMQGNLEWNGAISDDPERFVEEAISLYQDKNRWISAQQNGILMINERYEKSKFIPLLMKNIETLYINLKEHRNHNFIGQILQHQSLSSSKYMSLWIEEKNRNNASQ